MISTCSIERCSIDTEAAERARRDAVQFILSIEQQDILQEEYTGEILAQRAQEVLVEELTDEALLFGC